MGGPLKINGAVLEWAISRSGFDLEALASDFPKLESWIEDNSGPTFPQLERLATKLSLPTAVFFSPVLPDLPDPTKSFRSLPKHMRSRLPARIMKIIFGAQSHQISLEEIFSPQNRTLNLELLHSIDLDRGPKLSAQAARRAINVDLEQQLSWNGGNDAALKKWRDLITDFGIFVFADAFQSDSISGFCLYDAQYPVIVLNNSHTRSRQIFTIFHELAHLGLGTSGIDSPDIDAEIEFPEGQKIERFCDAFAAEFLAPSEFIRENFSNAGDIAFRVSSLAARLKVSRAVVLRKALETGNISVSEYDENIGKYLTYTRNGSNASSGNYFNNIRTYVGKKYLRSVFDLYDSNRIDDEDASRFLRVAPKTLEGLRPKSVE